MSVNAAASDCFTFKEGSSYLVKDIKNKHTDKNPTNSVKSEQKKTKKNSLAIQKKKALSHLELFEKELKQLKESILEQFDDMTQLEFETKKCEKTFNEVTQYFENLCSTIQTCTGELQDVEKRHKMLTADDLSDCTSENIEDISDILWAGLQSATLALSRRKDKEAALGIIVGSEEENESDTTVATRFSVKEVPEALFFPPATPALMSNQKIGEELCESLKAHLSFLKELHQKNSKETTLLLNQFKNLQSKVAYLNKDYGAKRRDLLSREQLLQTRLIQINRLTGRGSLENLSTNQLSDLCKLINKSSRKLATEQAIRQVRSQQKPVNNNCMPRGNIIQPVNNRCLVCFERACDSQLSPCNHLICKDCAERLKFCPQCRSKIEKFSPLENTNSDN